MKVCKIRPSYGTCSGCVDYAEMCGEVPNCAKCESDNEYELFETHFSFWNSYAVIIKNGKFEKVDISRVYDIREKGSAMERKL